MNEEERNLFEEAKLYLTHTADDDFNIEKHQIENRMWAIQYCIELIEKQQKEIERIKNFNYNTYIRKDTIRKKLEEIENSNTISIVEIYKFLKKISGE